MNGLPTNNFTQFQMNLFASSTLFLVYILPSETNPIDFGYTLRKVHLENMMHERFFRNKIGMLLFIDNFLCEVGKYKLLCLNNSLNIWRINWTNRIVTLDKWNFVHKV